MSAPGRLPFLSIPMLDETLGSWLFRAAAIYHSTPREFARAIAALDQASLPHSFDLDTRPPDELLDALAKHSALSRSEIARLTVHPGGSTLAAEDRDAYCPECMREDRERGMIYFRRAWLDGWVFTCERHQCLIGRFEPFEYQPTEPPSLRNLFPRAPERYRRNPSVIPVKLPKLLDAWRTPREFSASTLNAMLRTLAGRDLVLIMGSQAADSLVYDLTGIAPNWNSVWHTSSRAHLNLPEIQHPLGDITLRMRAAYLATVVWNQLRTLTRLPADIHSLLKPLSQRWPRDERERLGGTR
jgi:hypothetical protein